MGLGFFLGLEAAGEGFVGGGVLGVGIVGGEICGFFVGVRGGGVAGVAGEVGRGEERRGVWELPSGRRLGGRRSSWGGWVVSFFWFLGFCVDVWGWEGRGERDGERTNR